MFYKTVKIMPGFVSDGYFLKNSGTETESDVIGTNTLFF